MGRLSVTYIILRSEKTPHLLMWLSSFLDHSGIWFTFEEESEVSRCSWKVVTYFPTADVALYQRPEHHLSLV